MKILLMTPPLPDFDWKYGGFKGSMLWELNNPPLGLAYIASMLERSGHKVDILDCYVNKITLDKLKVSNSYDMIGMTSVSMNYPQAKESIKRLKEELGCKIVIGGPHPTSLPNESMKYCDADYLAIGEGELTMVDIANSIEKGSRTSDIKGILYRKRGRIIGTGPRALIQNLDDLPLPARHLLPLDKYEPEIEKNLKKPATSMITSRGCPYRCIFCCRNVFGNQFRAHSASYVLNEIGTLVDKYKIRDIIFFDDTFTVDRQRVLDICKGIKEDHGNLVWNCSSRVNTVTKETISAMADAGCYQIAFGVESGSQRILDLLKKGITLEQVEKAVRLAKKAGIEARCYFMLGIPGETIEDMRQTVNFAKKLGPDIVHFSIATPFPDTELSDIASKHTDKTWDDFCSGRDTGITEINLESMTRQQLIEFTNNAYREFYLRPSFILSRVHRLGNKWYRRRYIKAFKAIMNRYVG